MADRIKGITVVLGGDTTGLNKALASTNKEIKDTQSQLKDVERLLKLDPTNTELLAQKQRLLGNAVSETKTKLDTLKQAEKQVQEQFKRGEVSQQQYEGLQREIVATSLQLQKLEGDAQKAENAVNGIDEKPVEEVTSAARKAGQALGDAGKEASNFGDYLTAGAVIEGAKSLAGAIGSISDETKEFRKIMGTLEVSSEAAGYSADQTAEAYYQLYWVLGDDQSAATATANLQALKLEQSELNDLIELAIGAWATYGDSIPIDSLAESINETIKAGQVTGTFADVLNWGSREGETFGVMLKENTEANKEWNEAVAAAETAEDYFNLALQEATTEAERANIVMQAMANQGLAETAAAWYQNNKDIVNANDAQLNFVESTAELAERAAPAINAVKEGGNQLLNTFLDITENVDFEKLADTIDGVFSAVSDLIVFLVNNKEAVISTLLGIGSGIAMLKLASLANDIINVATKTTTLAATFPQLATAIGTLTNPVFFVTAAVVALVTLIATKGDEIQAILQKLDNWLQNVFAMDWKEIFGPVLGEYLNAFMANVKNIWDAIKRVFDGVIDFIRGVFTGDWERAWKGVQNIFGGIFDGLVAMAKAPINGVIGLLNGAINVLNGLIDSINSSLSISLPSWLGGGSWSPGLPSIPNIPYLAKGGTVLSGSAVVGEAGPELLTVGPTGTRVQPLTGSTTNNTNLGGVSVTVYGAPGQNVNELADIIMDKIQFATARRGAVFGA